MFYFHLIFFLQAFLAAKKKAVSTVTNMSEGDNNAALQRDVFILQEQKPHLSKTDSAALEQHKMYGVENVIRC